MHARKESTGWVAALTLMALLVALFTFAAAGCGESETADNTSSVPTEVLRLAYKQNVSTWDPSTGFGTEVVYTANVYEPLIYANPTGSSEPFSPCLATSWEVSDDGLEWTFYLRKGVTFHDGEPFNAEAVKYSFERTIDLNLGAAYLLSPIESIEVVDDYTVKFVLSSVIAFDRIVAGDYGAWIFSPKTKDWDTDYWDEGHEAGTGPYMLESYKPNEELVFARFADWWGEWDEKSMFEKVICKVVPEDGTQRQMLEASQVDFANSVPRDQVDALEANPDLTVYKAPSLDSYIMMFNTQRPPLDDVKVRQALSYAVPYEDIITVSVNGLGSQSHGPVPVGLWPNEAGDVPCYTTDYEKAAQLLAEAGYPDGEGIHKLVLTLTSENSIEQAYVPLIKEGFAKVGVEVQIKQTLSNQQNAIASGPKEDRQDLATLLWWPSMPDGYDNLSSMFRTEDPPAWNMAYWYNSEYDQKLTEAYALSATDPAKAQELYSECMNMLYEEAPAAYLFDAQTLVAYLRTIQLSDAAINFSYPQVLFWKEVTGK